MTKEEIEKIASDYLNDRESELDMIEVFAVAKEALEQKPNIGHCRDCKWWKDKDGVYRRGYYAESMCHINKRTSKN